MSLLLNIVSGLLIAAGVLFYAAGTIGLLRFPDVYSRLHALTKADNLGLGLLVLGLILRTADVFMALELVLIWLIGLISSATAGYLIANTAVRLGIHPKRDGQA